MKTVRVVGYQFDALPAHITILGRGEGTNLRIAVTRAVGNMLADKKLKHKQIGDFKMSAVVVGNGGGNGQDEASKGS